MLRPVAIQCGQTPGKAFPLFTPNDGWHWRMAMAQVQVADERQTGGKPIGIGLHVVTPVEPGQPGDPGAPHAPSVRAGGACDARTAIRTGPVGDIPRWRT